MTGHTKKRIAVLGFALESNRFAPVTTREDFESICFARGDDMLQASMLVPLLNRGGSGFGGVMTSLCDFEYVPILFGTGGAGGPCDHAFFAEIQREIKERLQEAGHLDGVFIIGHGAGITPKTDDMDGDYFETVRSVVGPDVPVVATLDLHGNVSENMVRQADVLISFLTNPHIDMVERSAEAAHVMHEIFNGMKPAVSFIRLPLMTPQVTQLTAEGHPYGDLIRLGQTFLDDTILNVSILSGFAFADTPHNGMAVIVTARGDQKAADDVAQKLANCAWSERHRYVPKLLTVEEALEKAATHTHTTPIILADIADNPGGGGRGNTTWIMKALHAASIEGVQVGIFYDPQTVLDAKAAGVGNSFDAHFNQCEEDTYSEPFMARATVLAITNGKVRGKRGTIKDTDINLGLSCLLEIGGMKVAVISIRQQLFSSETLEHFGLKPEEARAIVVKSRGHFRAGFEHIVPDEATYEVDAPGLTTPNLKQINWQNIMRPMCPIDDDIIWQAPESYRGHENSV